MKIVISGGTGYVGGAVLAECLKHPSITSVLVLSRREVPWIAKDAKAKVLIVRDFTSYDQATIQEVKSADAALWCLGTYHGDERIDIDYPLTFINHIKARPEGSTPFRFVQLSGAFTEPPPKEGEPERSLWFFTNGRRVRGKTEARVLETTREGPQNDFTVYLFKPGAILRRYSTLLRRLLGNSLTVELDELARTMVDTAVNGNEKRIFSNHDIIKSSIMLQARAT